MKFRLGKKVWSILLSVVMVTTMISPSFAIEENVVNSESEILVEETVKNNDSNNLEVSSTLSDVSVEEKISETETEEKDVANKDTATKLKTLADIEPLFISEICDPSKEFEKTRFIEIYNPTDVEVSLEGWKIEKIENADKKAEIVTVILSGNIASKGTYLVGPVGNTAAQITTDKTWGSFNGKDKDGAKLYKNETLVDEGYLLSGDSTTVRKINIVQPNNSYNSAEWEKLECTYVADTTVGSHIAGADLKEKVLKPKFNPSYSNIYLPTDIKLSCDTAGADIYYSIDNEKVEIKAENKYTEAIHADKAMVIRAISVKEGLDNSDISELKIVPAESHGTVDAPKTISEIVNNVGLGVDKVDSHEWFTVRAKVAAIDGDIVKLINEDGSAPDEFITFNKTKASSSDADIKAMAAAIKQDEIYLINAKYITYNSEHQIAFNGISKMIKIVANDTELPTFGEIKVEYCSINKGMVLTAKVDDNVGVLKATLYYKNAGDAEFKSKDMYYKDGVQRVVVFKEDITSDKIVYYIEATDGTNVAKSEEKECIADKTDIVLQLKELVAVEGTKIDLPKTVKLIKGGVESDAKVTWDAFAETTFGTYTVKGTVEGTAVKATITIKIEKEAPTGVIKIHEVQGNTSVSPYLGKEVTIEGIVTGFYSYKTDTYTYVQEEDTDIDADAKTSEAILVLGAAKVDVGKRVKLVGKVSEKNERLSEKSYAESLSTTVIECKNILEISKDIQELPKPVLIGKTNPVPERIFDASKGQQVEDVNRVLEPSKNAIDFYEAYECMRVEVELPKVVGIAEKYGNIYVVPSKGEGYKGITPNGGVKAISDYHYGNIITLDFGLNPIIDKDKEFINDYSITTGDQYESNITGIVRYQFGDYKISYDGRESITKIAKTDSGVKRAVTTLTSAPDKLTVASYNIENFTGNAPQEKVDNVAASIVDNLKTPDIIGLVEVQDNDGEGGDSSAANKSYERVIAAIKEKSGITYAYTQIDPVHGMDGGAPGSNIRVGYLYNPLRVKLGTAVDGEGNSTTEAKMVQKDGKWMLANNPARLGIESKAFIETRKSLVACFNFRGEDIYIVANHFSSKRGETGPFGNVQPPAVNPANRIAQATLINDFIEKQILANKADAKVIVLGDMNDFEYSPTLKALEGSKLYNMHYSLDENKRYTYIHSGLSQTLDHILVTKAMKDSVEFEPVHMNAEFTIASGRASDHDALMARFSGIGSGEVNLLAPPTASLASGEVVKGTSITVESAADTVVYYTVDGKVPDNTSSNNKTNKVELSINKDTTVKAIAISGDKESAVMTWTYTLPMEKSTIAEAKKANKGTAVYVEGIAQNIPGAFGDSGFYIVDDTEAVFIYPAKGANTSDIKLGTVVRVKGIMDNFKGLIQVKPTQMETLSQGNKFTVSEVKANELDKHIDNLVKVNEAEVIKVETPDKYNNTIIELKKDGFIFTAKLDARSGFAFVEGKYKVGMKLDITGFVKDAKSIAVRSFDDMAIVGATPENKIALLNLELKDLNGKVIKTVKENGFVMISVMTKNDAAIKDTVGTLIFKIEKDNKPVRMGIIGTAMANDGVYSLGFDTKAMPKGKYEVKVYYWNTLAGQKPVAEPVTLTFDIE